MSSPTSVLESGVLGNSRRRILFLTTVGFAESAGGVVYSRAIREALATQGTVTVVALSELQRHPSRRRRWLSAAVQSLRTGVPPNVLFHAGNLSPAGLKIIDQSWDLVVIDHLESAFARPSTPAVLYISHNRESDLVSQKLPRAPHWAQRLLSAWVDHYERKTVRSVDGVITISSAEANWYRTLNPRVAVIPPVFKTTARPVRPAAHGRLRVGFLGSAKWLPNRDAIDLLFRQILPRTHRPVELIIAGGGWDEATLPIKLNNADGQEISLNYLGYIDDIDAFWLAIDVFAAPIATGAGVNVKVCEALANARPVIALPHALRGLDGISQDLICRVASASEFASAIDVIDPASYPLTQPDSLRPAHAARTVAELLAAVPSIAPR